MAGLFREEGTTHARTDIGDSNSTVLEIIVPYTLASSRNNVTVFRKHVTSTHWAKTLIESAASYGWINGYSDGTFLSEGMITINTHFTSLRQFPDLQNKSDWYFYDMVEATNAHRSAAYLLIIRERKKGLADNASVSGKLT